EMRSNGRTRWRKLIQKLTEDEGHPDHPHNRGLWKLNKWSRKEIGTQGGQAVIPGLRTSDTEEATNNNDAKANILAVKFFPQSGAADTSDIEESEEFERFEIEATVSTEELIDVINKLPNRKAPGPDMIPNEAIKALKN